MAFAVPTNKNIIPVSNCPLLCIALAVFMIENNEIKKVDNDKKNVFNHHRVNAL